MSSKQVYLQRIEEIEVEFMCGRASWRDFYELSLEIHEKCYHSDTLVMLVNKLMNVQCRLERYEKEEQEFMDNWADVYSAHDMDDELPF